MASSRASSPANNSSPTSPVQLTPTSKVKALLASFGDDSDDEVVSSSAKAKSSSIISKNPPTKSRSPSNTETSNRKLVTQEVETGPSAEVDDDDEDGDDNIRPMGRMAGRMQAAEDNSELEVVKRPDDARERVKRMLMARSKTPELVAGDEDSENNDENDVSVLPRKRKVRVTHHGTPTSSPEQRSHSPALFVSPTKVDGRASDSSDAEELPLNPLKNERFKALVEKKRQERLEKEAREAEEKSKMLEQQKKQAALLEEDDINDDFVDQRLTQQTKPTRKVGKKASEERAKETQRLSRSMQLAHQPKTKKKFTKDDLFKRYNYRASGSTEEGNAEHGPTSSSPAPHSDIEMHETPPTSPASQGGDHEKLLRAAEVSNTAPMMKNQLQTEEDTDLQAKEDAYASSSPKTLDKGKGRVREDPWPAAEVVKKPFFKQRPVRIRPSIFSNEKSSALDDSDSDLEILTAKTPDARKKKLDDIFDRIPAKQAKEPHSLVALKMLAHLKSPGKRTLGRNQMHSLTTSELQLSLQKRARQQAAREKEEKLEVLKAKGVIVPTAEEREKALAEVEDLMAKARREGEEIRRREKEAAKRERKGKDEGSRLEDSSDDEDWEDESENKELSDSDSEDEDDDASDASGEEEDEDEDEDEEDEENDEEDDELLLGVGEQSKPTATNPLFDDEADESDENEAESHSLIEKTGPEAGYIGDDLDDDVLPVNPQNRRARKSNVIDEEDEEELNPAVKTPSAPRTNFSVPLYTESPKAPNSVLRSATKTFIPGLTVAGPAGLGLTQIFAGTMDESQIDTQDEKSIGPNPVSKSDGKQDSLAFLRGLATVDLPPFVPTMEDDSQDIILDSQTGTGYRIESQSAETQTQGLQLGFTQSQVHGFDSLVDPMATQVSEFPEATQDVGFQHMTPIRARFLEPLPSTVDTVVMEQASAPQPLDQTPIVKKKGKLRRRVQLATFSDEENGGDPAHASEQEDDFEIPANVFDVMRKASKKKEVVVDEFDKKTSKAKEMVHEQAEESEDEYAGLGGASDDESGGEEDEYVKEMIDDEGGKDVDKSKLAAFYA
jgi:mediator of replication checkpoint protein 1